MQIEIPFHLMYELTRRQRFLPHLKVWMPYLPSALALVVGSLLLVRVRWWLFPFTLFAFWMTCGLWVGFVEIAFRSVKPMDIVVEENGLGFLAGGERCFLFLDGIRFMKQLIPGVWTIYHHNGHVVHIPNSAITADQVSYIKEIAAKGKTPEGVQAVIERGHKIQQMRMEQIAQKNRKA
jgi:hypothetical protein